MNHIKNIIVPIDFSDLSIYGLKAACDMANIFGSKIHLGHFIAPSHVLPDVMPESAMGSAALIAQQLEHAHNAVTPKLEVLMRKYVPEENRGEIHTVPASIYNNFDIMIEKFNADLVVTGTSGSRDFLEWFVGNKTENMIRQGDVPVLAVSSDRKIEFNKVLIATDLESEIPAKLFGLCRLLSEHDTCVHLAHVISTELISRDEVVYKLNALAVKNGLHNYRWNVTENSSQVEGLLDIINEEQPDLLLMKTYDKSDIWSFLSGSLAEKMVRKADVPTMLEPVG